MAARITHGEDGRVCEPRSRTSWKVAENPANRGVVGLTCYRGHGPALEDAGRACTCLIKITEGPDWQHAPKCPALQSTAGAAGAFANRATHDPAVVGWTEAIGGAR